MSTLRDRIRERFEALASKVWERSDEAQRLDAQIESLEWLGRVSEAMRPDYGPDRFRWDGDRIHFRNLLVPARDPRVALGQLELLNGDPGPFVILPEFPPRSIRKLSP